MKKYFWKCLVALTALFSGCNPGSISDSNNIPRLINDAANNQLAEITIGGSEVTMTDKHGQLTGILKKDKRKYYTPSNNMEYAVKFSDDGFKLRDHNEQLLWKIKLYDDKIKIANNEEMMNAYEVKLRDQGRLKIERNEQEVFTLRVNEGAAWNLIEGKFGVKGFGVSLAPGVLMIDGPNDREKFIIMAELAAKGK